MPCHVLVNSCQINNQRTNTWDRTGANSVAYFYNRRGQLERSIDPLLNTTTNYYDDANRLERVSNQLGQTVTNVYDANGNRVTLVDQLGQRWRKGYDRLNRVETETDPEQNSRRTTYDEAGRVHQLFTPKQFASTHEYDGRGRLRKWTDAEDYPWVYAYDPVGNITNITDALNGHYVMTYGPRNERLSEKNQDNFEWTYRYDELLRLREQIDPNRVVRKTRYDLGSRVREVSFSTGRVNRINPDENDNPKSIEREDSGQPPMITFFAYDVLDRVTNVVDTVSNQRVAYVYDPLGRPTNLIYPTGKILTQKFDAVGRLTNQVFQFDAPRSFAASYTFDPAGRLVSRTYPNGIIQTNGFDPAGRLTNLVYQASGSSNPASTNSINIALTYAYDRNGNKTGSGEKGTLRWSVPPLTDESSTFTNSGRLATRTIANRSTPDSLPVSWKYSYDDTGNLTQATNSTGASYAVAYDEDNRTTSIGWQSGTTNTVIGNRYDALGRRVARTVSNGGETTETRYVLNLVGAMERILCDADAGGSISAWYVHGPDLAFGLDADGSVLCYHADAQANVIALTGADGTNLVQYAYTPYGRVLSTTNYPPSTILTSQPYKFVGSQGVMEEFPGLYFMRARYYSAEAGVFLSTDPVKKIGPGWRSVAYAYAKSSPMAYFDPNGEDFGATAAIVIKAILAADYFLEWADLLIADADNVLKVRTGQMSEADFNIQRASDVIDVSLGGKFLEGIKVGIGIGEAANSGDWLSVVPVVSPLRSMNRHIDSIGNTARANNNSNSSRNSTSRVVVNNSRPDRTAAVVAPKGAATTSATSTTPSGASNGGTTSSGGGGGKTITIQSGATLSGIARDNNTTVSALMAANPQISNPDRIYAGANLNVPNKNTGGFGGFGGGTTRGSGTSGSWP